MRHARAHVRQHQLLECRQSRDASQPRGPRRGAAECLKQLRRRATARALTLAPSTRARFRRSAGRAPRARAAAAHRARAAAAPQAAAPSCSSSGTEPRAVVVRRARVFHALRVLVGAPNTGQRRHGRTSSLGPPGHSEKEGERARHCRHCSRNWNSWKLRVRKAYNRYDLRVEGFSSGVARGRAFGREGVRSLRRHPRANPPVCHGSRNDRTF